MHNHSFIKLAAVNWIILSVLAVISLRAVLGEATHMPAKLIEAYTAVGTVLLAQLFHPRGTSPGCPSSVIRSLTWSLSVGVLSVALILFHDLHGHGVISAAKLGLGVSITVFLLTGFTNLINLILDNEQQARLVSLIALVLSCCAPVWLGPVAERAASPGTLVNTIIASSPLTYFSVIADIDYLRSNWFYMHTPYGGMRYSYPGALAYSFVYCMLALLFVFFTTRLHYKRYQVT